MAERTREQLLRAMESWPKDVDTLFELAILDRDTGTPTQALASSEAWSTAAIIRQHERDMLDLEKEYQSKVRSLQDKIRVRQKACPHTYKKRHPDPSGNNDSSTECLACGAEVR